MARLVYQTTDGDFADRAIFAIRKAGISCYRVGHGDTDRAQHAGRALSENQICLYIEHGTDYAEAIRILIGLGAVV